MCRGLWPRLTAAAQSRLRVVSISTGSSDEIEHFTPAASIRGSGCSSKDGTTPRSTLLAEIAARGDLGEQRGVLDGAHAVP